MMRMPFWAVEAADAFWDAAGEIEPFPRDLRRPIANTMPLAIVLLPALRLASITACLFRYGVRVDLLVGDRALYACLVARRGHGIIFLDGTLHTNELRVSLAHELAHFLRHYLQPRQESVRKLGAVVLEVLDGDRPALIDERIAGVLSHTPLGFHFHLMCRESEGGARDRGIDVAERDADLLAYELLAPSSLLEQASSQVSPGNVADSLLNFYVIAMGFQDRRLIDTVRS